MARNDGQIVIKKYANRRLYNTGTSTYVTLDDLAVMVKKGEDFTVQDAKSGEEHFFGIEGDLEGAEDFQPGCLERGVARTVEILCHAKLLHK